jgi:glycosyltransferase involved in cell wall biosynthesis
MKETDQGIILSIVLVCLNNFADFTLTVSSLKKLKYPYFKLIVIDSSNDLKIKKFVDIEKSFDISYLWQEKNGIYAAMNLGIENSEPNSFVWFLNPGDVLVDSEVVTDMLKALGESSSKWGFAQARNAKPNENQIYPKKIDILNKKSVAKGNAQISHQAIFVCRESLIANGYFDTSYRIASDQAMLMKLVEIPSVFIPKVIVEIDQSGISGKFPFQTIFETIKVNYLSGTWNLSTSLFKLLAQLIQLSYGTLKLKLAFIVKSMRK